MAKIGKIRCERKHRHHFARNSDHGFRFSYDTILTATETDDGLADCTITDVNNARPGDASQINVERVAVMKMVVEERRCEIMRCANGVHVTGEMKVELFHRNHLAVATSRGATLDAKHWPKAWLANGDGGAVTNLVEPLRETDGGGGLPFSEWGWADRRDDNVLSAYATLL